MKTVDIPRRLVNQLLEQALRSPDTEVCGLIGGQGQTPTHCYPASNVAAHPDHQFQLDPAQQIDAMRQMRERGETLFAIYHSHPTSSATPSKADIEQAAYPEALYLIISLSTTGTLQMRGFYLEHKTLQAVDVSIIDPL